MSLQCLAQSLKQTGLQQLRKHGYCVIDNAFPEALAHNILSEMKALQEFDVMYPCHTHINKHNETALVPKFNVWELELHSYPELQSICTCLWKVLNDETLCNVLNMNDTRTNYEYVEHTLKLLYSVNNGCFPVHFDSDLDIDLRRITAVLYLNEDTMDGGEIRLYPLLDKPIDVTPKYNRMVLFSSCFMLHRTLPTMQQRYALNFWLHTKQLSMEDKVTQNDKHAAIKCEDNACQYLLQPKYLKCLAKLLYDDEWTQSIIDSHKEQNDIEWLLYTHKNDVQLSQNILSSLDIEQVYHNLIETTKLGVNDRYLSHQMWGNCEIDWMC